MSKKEKLDKETQEILEEMKEDGVGETPEEEEEEEESSEEQSSEETEEESEDDASEDNESETSEKEEEEEEDDESDPEPSPYKQPVMSVAKHQKKKKNWAKKEEEYQKKIEQLEQEVQKKQDNGLDENVSQLAEKYGFEKDFVKDIADAVKSTLPNVSEELKVFREKQAEQNQLSLYAEDFEKNISPILSKEYPEITQSKVNKIQAELKKLKFTKELAAVPLDYIFIRHKNKFDSLVSPQKKKSAEKSRAGSGSREKVVDYSELTPEDIKNMSDADFDKYSEAMGKQKSRLEIVSK